MNLSDQLISDNIDFACRLKDCLYVLKNDIELYKGINGIRYKISVACVTAALSVLPQTSPFDYTPRSQLDLLYELDTLIIALRSHYKAYLDDNPEISLIYAHCFDMLISAYNNVYNVYQNLNIAREL